MFSIPGFLGDPDRWRGSGVDGKAVYAQLDLVGVMGRSLGSAIGKSCPGRAEQHPAPPGVKAYLYRAPDHRRHERQR